MVYYYSGIYLYYICSRNVLLQCFTSTVKLFIGKRRNTLFYTRQKLSRCKECALSLSLDERRLEDDGKSYLTT